MTRARKHLVCVADTPYYHITARCVRRAFLCGVDKDTGKDYEHRRGWIETRIRVLSSVFCIDVCAYAVMSNHYHLVVKLCPLEVNLWPDDEVLKRWTVLFRGPLLVQHYRAGGVLSEAEGETLKSIIAVYRKRLGSLSWFMKCLNEPIARKANAEDHCRGHFWEARFHSQALLSEKALFTAMAYVDLNPVRAKLAKTPETSEYTSISVRLRDNDDKNLLTTAIQQMIEGGELNEMDFPVRTLMPFVDDLLTSNDRNRTANTLPMQANAYYQLVDATARIHQQNKRGRLDHHLAPILKRLGINDGEEWIDAASDFRKHYWNGDLRIRKPA